jgi:hypothetical protein
LPSSAAYHLVDWIPSSVAWSVDQLVHAFSNHNMVYLVPPTGCLYWPVSAQCLQAAHGTQPGCMHAGTCVRLCCDMCEWGPMTFSSAGRLPTMVEVQDVTLAWVNQCLCIALFMNQCLGKAVVIFLSSLWVGCCKNSFGLLPGCDWCRHACCATLDGLDT